MGLFDKILRSMPGSPKSVANNLLENYLKVKKDNPGLQQKEIYACLLNSRYAILQTMNASQIREAVDNSESLIELAMFVIARENPAAVSPIYQKNTTEDVLTFFATTAPSEYEKFVRSLFPDRDSLPDPKILASALSKMSH